MDEELDNLSGSDFDDDEDPDKIEVPGKKKKRIFCHKLTTHNIGGGKDLASAASIQETRENKLKQEDTKVPPMPMGGMGGNSKMTMPMGGYGDMMRNAPSKFFFNFHSFFGDFHKSVLPMLANI